MPTSKTFAWTIACAALVAAAPLTAHEYWIAVDPAQPQPGETVCARLLVGQMMQGSELPWLTHQVASFEIVTAGGRQPVAGREGDLPAACFVAEQAGLMVIAQETLPLTVTFDSFAEFVEYLDYEGLGEIATAHRARGLPMTGITEAYRRSAKALVRVGDAKPEALDRPLGLRLELVALDNPWAGEPTLPVRLLWQGQPLAGRQVAVFRDGGAVERTVVNTDADGHARIPLDGGGLFMLNAVHIEPADAATHAWESDWASLTFTLPAR